MSLTNEQLAAFVGRDLEARLYKRCLLFRGPIETATIDDGGILRVHFRWLAENDSGPDYRAPTWHKDGQTELGRDLLTFTEETKADGTIRLISPIRDEVLIFCTPGDNLKPSQVAGHPGAPST